MSSAANKFVYTIQAEYEGESAFKAFSSDLNDLKDIQAFTSLNSSLAENRLALAAAEKEAADLATALAGSKDPKLAAGIGKTSARLEVLTEKSGRQVQALDILERELVTAKQKYDALAASYANDPTDTLAANYKKAGEAVDSLTIRIDKKRLVMAKEDAAIQAATKKLASLKTAYAASSDPAIAAQYKVQADQVKKLADQIGRQEQSYSKLETSLKAAKVDTENLAAAEKKLETAAKSQGRVLAAQNALGVRSFQDVRSEMAAVQKAYVDLKESGKFSTQELVVYQDRMREKMAGLKQEMNGWPQHLQRIQNGWAGILGVVTSVGIAGKAVMLFAGFDDTMRQVAAVSQATNAEMAQMTELAQKLGASTRFTATEVAAGMKELAQSGASTAEIMTVIPHVLDMSAASGLGFKESADLVTDTMAQFGISMENAQQVTDLLAKGGLSAGHSVDEMGNALSYVGPIANAMGYSLDQAVAIVDALADAGYKGERGGTALRGGLVRLINPTREAAAVLDAYNIQVQDSQGKTRNFADIIDDLGKAGLTQAEVFKLFGQEAGPGMQALLSQGGAAIRAYQTDLQHAGGFAKQTATDMEAGIGGAMRKLSASIQSIALSFADVWAPAITWVADRLTWLAGVMTNLSTPMKLLLSTAGAAATAFAAWRLGIAPLYSAFQLMSGGSLTLAGSMTKLAGGVNVATFAVKAFQRAFIALAIFEVAQMVAKWLWQFDFVKKGITALAETFVIGALQIKKAWKWITGGDTQAVQQEIDATKKRFSQMYADIDAGAKETGTKHVEVQAKTAEAVAGVSANIAAQQQQIIDGEAAIVEARKKTIAELNQEIPEYAQDDYDNVFGYRKDDPNTKEDESTKQLSLEEKYGWSEQDIKKFQDAFDQAAGDALVDRMDAAAEKIDSGETTGMTELKSALQEIAGKHEVTVGTTEKEQVKKVVELKFEGGSVSGSEADVEALLSQLEAAGARA